MSLVGNIFREKQFKNKYSVIVGEGRGGGVCPTGLKVPSFLYLSQLSLLC
jgi:hypothetical protein